MSRGDATVENVKSYRNLKSRSMKLNFPDKISPFIFDWRKILNIPYTCFTQTFEVLNEKKHFFN